MSKRIEHEWLGYRAEVLPGNASEAQLTECRKAFYAGAVAAAAQMSNPEALLAITGELLDFVEALAVEESAARKAAEQLADLAGAAAADLTAAAIGDCRECARFGREVAGQRNEDTGYCTDCEVDLDM